MKERLFSNWYPLRWIALAAGLFMMVQAIRFMDGLSALLGGFMLYQAITNKGCLVGQNCSVSRVKEAGTQEVNSVEYTEIKNE
ncbi:hypothetical protein [Fodinibius saliphilus]|uniref:hypothetical protein n=1 Tax=Fodinibius saliphilus TaxID=1920650 RepID=UPI001109754B|nr:hypothetical protein [Fodinibius saliphilus]